jgi:hypothetical protein
MATTGSSSRSAGAPRGAGAKRVARRRWSLSNGSWGCGQSRGAVSSMKRVDLDEKDWINVSRANRGLASGAGYAPPGGRALTATLRA